LAPSRRLVDGLARLARRKGGCISVAEAAALLRATPSEVVEAARLLGAEEDSGGALCLPASGGRRGRKRWRLVQLGGCCVVAVAPRRAGLPGLVEAAKLAAALASRMREELCRGRGCSLVVPLVEYPRGVRLVEGVLAAGEVAAACRGLPAAARRYSCDV